MGADKLDNGKTVHHNYLLREQGKLNKILALQKDNDIISMLLDGKTTKEIVKYVSQKYGGKANSITTQITNCRNEIRRREAYEANNIISIHIHRYEEVYRKLLEIGAEGMAMTALKAKEKLMGFHREGFHMRVSQGQIQQVNTTLVMNEYDFEQLSKQKRQRLDELLNKARNERSSSTKLIRRAN